MGKIEVDEDEFNKYKRYYESLKRYRNTDEAKQKNRERVKEYYHKNKNKKILSNKINYYKKKNNEEKVEYLKKKLIELSKKF